jgi:nuclear pore complex protein Nup43
LNHSDIFVTGSWDDQSNKVYVWQLPTPNEILDEGEDLSPEVIEPRQICETEHSGDVSALQFMNQDNFITGSSNGSVTLYKLGNLQMWRNVQTWSDIHKFPVSQCTCTGVACMDDHIVSVGEDGRIAFISVTSKDPLRVIDKADSCSLTAVDMLKQQEIITANMRGQLKIWDMRSHSDKPSRIFHVCGEEVSVQCVSHHPTQPQLVATGQEDGLLCLWDMRYDKNPLTLLQAHDGAVTEVKFHPTSPDHLFTCSLDGSVWHWDGSSLSEPIIQGPKHKGGGKENEEPKWNSGVGNPWLMCDAAKHRLDIYTLIPSSHLPVNSLDVSGNTLLCGSDNEAIYMVKHLKV